MEIWKTMIYQGETYPRFQISNFGNLRNCYTGTIYKQNSFAAGYIIVCVSLGSRNRKKAFKIHRAVAETFIPNPNNLPVINHKDGNKLNNNVDNLEWCTQKDNVNHAYNEGLCGIYVGEENFHSKLTQKDVDFIRESYIPRDKKYGCRALARRYNVHHSTIENIINNKTWQGGRVV